MSTIQTIQQAEAALQPYVPLVAQLTGKHTTMDRIVPLMELLDNPQDTLRIIHVAGTSGKTSTSYYIAALLQVSGKKVGLTVSPHIDSITERLQINGQPISDDMFCAELTEFLDLIKDIDQPPSYFELLYAFALWSFERQNIDYAVIETGMGGLYDATNVAKRADKVCVITDIGLDHTHILGKTIPEITAQKIGIVHPHNAVLMYEQSKEVMQVVDNWVQTQHATLHTTSQQAEEAETTNLEQLIPYQKRNWLLAYYVYKFLINRDKLEHLTSKVLQQTQHIKIPGRMDISRLGNKTIIMDGAHNQQKMSAFVDSFQTKYPGSKPAIMIALKEGKEYQEVAKILAPIASQVIVTTFNTSQDLPAKSTNPDIVAQAFRQESPQLKVTVKNDQAEALQMLLAAPQEIGIITGSFYLLAQIRKLGAY